MNRNESLDQIACEIELLARMHILYGMERTPQFEAQKAKISQLLSSRKINARAELDPVSRNLYCRFFG